MYKVYTDNIPKNIDTLEELDASGLKIITSSPSYRNIFGDNQSVPELFRSLKAKIFFENSHIQSIDRVLSSNDICTLERRTDTDIKIQTRYLNDDGTPKLHVVKECPRHYFLTYIVYKDFPLLYRFNKLILRYTEAGSTFLKLTEKSEFTKKNYFFEWYTIQGSVFFGMIKRKKLFSSNTTCNIHRFTKILVNHSQ